MRPAALEPCALAAARIVAEHIGMRPEARDDLLDRAMHLTLIGDVCREAIHICGDSRRRRCEFAIDYGNFVDYFFFEQRIYDSESESSRSAGYDCVFHCPNSSYEDGALNVG